jgi:antirestriction protein ArdC
MKRDLYAEVSARIVAELQAGAAAWVKPSRRRALRVQRPSLSVASVAGKARGRQ